MDNGLLTSRRDGLWIFYSALNGGNGNKFIQSVKYLFEEDPLYRQDLQEAARLLEKRSEEATRFFDSIAEDWEKLKHEIIGDTDLNGMILENVPSSGTIVDLGCGTGDLLAPLKQKANFVIGVDKSPKMLQEAQQRFAGDGENINLRIGQMEHLPLREGEADGAVINMVMHHLPEPLKAIREVHRVLKHGDTFIVVDLLNHRWETMRERYGDRWLGFSREDMEKWLKTGGFVLKKIKFFDLKKNLKGFIITSVKR